MDIIEHGKVYSLANFGEENGSQDIRFTEKKSNGEFIPGTTNEEVIAMMIDRYHFLNKTNFSPENQTVILLLKNIRQIQRKRLSRKIEKVIKYKENNKR